MRGGRRRPRGGSALVFAALAAAVALVAVGCAPALVAVGAAHVAMIASDPRSTGAQLNDETIELTVANAANGRWGESVHLNVTSFNGYVLLSGEAPTVAVRTAIVELAQATERVRRVFDEMGTGPVADFGARSNDGFVTSKVKTRMLDADSVSSLYVKVVTERKVVYLMGIVTPAQGDAAANVAATTDGVARVVKLFEYTK